MALPETTNNGGRNGHLPDARPSSFAAEGIRKTYGSRRVVDDVSLYVDQGEIVGLLGANGAGKTTTFYMMVGLEPTEHGRITLNGDDVTKLPMYLRARLGVGYLPRTMGEALDAFEADPLSRQVFGQGLFTSLLDYKRDEWLSYTNHVSDWEKARYLKMF